MIAMVGEAWNQGAEMAESRGPQKPKGTRTPPAYLRWGWRKVSELRQQFGHESANHLRSIINGQAVTVRHHGHKSWSRIVGSVSLNGIDVGLRMVEDGFAWQDPRYSSDLFLECLEYTARAEQLGLWSDPSPVPPWEWRKVKAANR